jgi:1,4-dihydroxy-2-naphthoate octaprenyltransferase
MEHNRMKNMRYLLGALRLNFLVLTPVCIFLALAIVVHRGAAVRWADAFFALLGALAAHASVNLLNEYSDFRSGLDLMAKRTPFSGGSGTLPEHPEAATATLNAGIVTLGLAAGVGVYFLSERGLALLPLGLVGLLVVAVYTVWITRHPLLCLLAPGLGFGPLMVMGTGFALTGTYTWAAFVVSLMPFFLVGELLLLNQFPDVEPDREAGRRHLPIVLGRQPSAWIFAGFLLAAYLTLIGGVVAGLFPIWALIGLAPLPLAVVLARSVIRYADDLDRLVPWMGVNVGVIMATLVLTALGILIG